MVELSGLIIVIVAGPFILINNEPVTPASRDVNTIVYVLVARFLADYKR